MTGAAVRFRDVSKTACSILPTLLLLPTAVAAQTVPRVTVDVSANVAADSNPFYETDGKAALSATLNIDPKVYWEDEKTNVVVDANWRMTQYLQRYGTDVGGRLGVLATRQLSTRTSLNASAGFQSSRSRVQDFFFGTLSAPLDPIEFPDVQFTDVTVTGRRTRTQTLDASLGLDHILSEDQMVGVFGATSYSRFSAADQSDFRTATLGARYRRQLSERTSITASVTGTAADYIGTNVGDARIINPQVGIEKKINERVSFTANVGVAVASVDDAFKNSQTNTYVTGSISACDRGVVAVWCGSISRSAGPTALGGIRAVTNISLVFDKQLSSKDRINLSGRLGETSQSSMPLALPGSPNTRLYGITGSYSRDINDRLAFVVTPSFSKVLERRVRDEANYSINIGIRYRFGKLR